MLHTVRGRFGRALRVLHSGLRIAADIGHREYVVGNRFGLGMLYLELLAPDQARGQVEEALAIARELRSPAMIHNVSGVLAAAYLQLGDLESAQACLEMVISHQTPMDTTGKRYCWVRRAELALAQDDPALAFDITERLIASAPGMSPGRVITYLWKLKAEALAAMGRAEEACPLLRAAVENARATEERFLLWRVHGSLGRLYRDMGHREAAENELSAARGLIDELAATVPDEALRENFVQRAHNILELP
jgi:tetratricopeptide (TPR) repeat protein